MMGINLLFQIPMSGDIPLDQLEGSIVGPIVESLQPYILKFSVLVGGLFGIFIIISLYRVHYERKKLKILSNILYDLDQLNMHFKLNHSQMRKSIFRRIIDKIKNIANNPKVEESSTELKSKKETDNSKKKQ